MQLCKRWNGEKCIYGKGHGNTWCKGSLETCNVLLRAWDERIDKLTKEGRARDLKSKDMGRIKSLAVRVASLSDKWLSLYTGIMNFNFGKFAKECLNTREGTI